MNTRTRTITTIAAVVAITCTQSACAAGDAEEPDPEWQTYEHGIGLENGGADPYVILTRKDTYLELRPPAGEARCGDGTWDQLMNALAIDQNDTLRMHTKSCGNNVQIFIDTLERRTGDMPASDMTGFVGAVSIR